MELTQLRYFLEVARSEHMTNSARKLHIAQPALTQSIHRLEDELGVSLFERAGRNICLTQTGAYLRDRIAPALESMETLADDVRAFDDEQRRIIRVGIFSASGVTIDGIAAYTAENEHATFRITQNQLEGTCDITITTTSFLLEPASASANCATFTERIGVAVPASSPYASAGTIPLASLAHERFVCLAGSRRFREICDALCTRRAFTPHVEFESDNPAVVKKIIGLGLGVGFWPTRSWESLEGSSARLVKLEEPEFERTVVIKRAPHVQDKSEAARFFRFLVEYVANRWKQHPTGKVIEQSS